MKYTNPKEVISPIDFIKNVEVLHDGGAKSFSIAKLNWNDEEKIGIRWNISEREWDDEEKKSEKANCIGMPNSHGLPIWFIVPDELLNHKSSIWKSILHSKEKDLRKKILVDIEKTGFITELKTESLLVQKGWKTLHSITYEDKDENKNREIDIYAYKSFLNSEIGLYLTINLVASIKKSDKHWIFFTSPKPFPQLGWQIPHLTINATILESRNNHGQFTDRFLFDVNSIDQNNPREKINFVGKSFHEFGKEPGDKSKIYEALISSCKAAKYYLDNNMLGTIDTRPASKTGLTRVELFLPIVILEGYMFEVNLNPNNGNINLEESNYIPIELKYSSPAYREGGYDADFFPDVITFSGIGSYIGKIEIWAESMMLNFGNILREYGKLPWEPK